MREIYYAVDRETGNLFGGKRQGTHVGYPRRRFLLSAITNAEREHKEFIIRKLNVVTGEITIITT